MAKFANYLYQPNAKIMLTRLDILDFAGSSWVKRHEESGYKYAESDNSDLKHYPIQL